MKLKGKCAVVTGGAMGIGLATVRLLLKEGCRVTVWDLKDAALQAVAEELKPYGDDLFVHQCDVSDEPQVNRLAELADHEMGRVDILINNAGIVTPGYFHQVDNRKHERTVSVNLNALIYTTHAVLPGMYARNEGIVVNISSAAGVLGVPGQAVYAATKWAVLGLTESLRHEAANLKKNVRFASVHPGYLAKGLFEGARMTGLGGLIVPLVKNHGVIAKAIVGQIIKRKRALAFRPRSVRVAPLLRGILPNALFIAIIRILNVHRSMGTWKGRSDG